MSNVSVSVKYLIAVLKMPSKLGDKIIRALAIVGKLTGNANFPLASWPANVVSLAQFSTDVNTLVAAQTAVANKTSTTAARKAALVVVMNDLKSIMTMVQLKADANVANAETIILSAGYLVRTSKTKVKQQNDALNTEVLGTVLLTADTAGHHEWQQSKDGGITIINLPSTSTSKTYVYNLNTGDVWYFRNHKVNTKKSTYNWSAWIKLIVGSGGKTVGGGTLPGHAGGLPTA
jgi:hypothetical protein